MLRDSIRTHERHETVQGVGKSYGLEIPQRLIDEVHRMRRARIPQREIYKELRIGAKTYRRIVLILRSKP